MLKTCPKSDTYNCKYCSLAGRICAGAPGYERQLLREDYVEAEGTYIGAVSYGYICKEWTFHYSDGTKETVTTRTRKPC